jgi:hypothetical protein
MRNPASTHTRAILCAFTAAIVFSACGPTEPRIRPTDIVVAGIDTLRSVGATAIVSGVGPKGLLESIERLQFVIPTRAAGGAAHGVERRDFVAACAD